MNSGGIYPYDLPGAIARVLPTMKNKMTVTLGALQPLEVDADFDESGLVAIHDAPEGGYSVTHVPTGVRFHYRPMPMADALDFANWLVARLDAIKALKLDYVNVTELNQPTIIADPGNINKAELNWRRHYAAKTNEPTEGQSPVRLRAPCKK